MNAHFSTAMRCGMQLRVAAFVVLGLGLGLGLSGPAQALDGCKLLLCMAGNWQSIGQCTPTVREALRDLARGRAWPRCAMGGSSDSANQFVAAWQCPPQYRVATDTDDFGRAMFSCPFAGVVQVAVDGEAWSRTWWSMSGDAVVEWLPAARLAFGQTPMAMDDRFDRDLATWLVSERARLAAEAAAALGDGR